MRKLIKAIKERNKLRKFRNNLIRGQRVKIKASDNETIFTSIIFVSNLERKVVIHTSDHPYESFELNKVFPINH